jgi:hypothetical protein
MYCSSIPVIARVTTGADAGDATKSIGVPVRSTLGPLEPAEPVADVDGAGDGGGVSSGLDTGAPPLHAAAISMSAAARTGGRE